MKAHLITTEFPIVSGQSQTADCGVEVPNAQIVFMWDEQQMGHWITYSKNICKECWLSDSGPRNKMFVYGITERQIDASTDTTAGEE